MLNSQVQLFNTSNFTFLKKKPFYHGNCSNANLFHVLSTPLSKKHSKSLRVGPTSRHITKAALTSIFEDNDSNTKSVKGILTVKHTVSSQISSIGIDKPIDGIKGLLGVGIQVELVSAQLDPKTGLEKTTIKSRGRLASRTIGEAKYELDFKVPETFGEIAAILIENRFGNEMFIQDVVIDGLPNSGLLKIICESWVQPIDESPKKRVFFTNKLYLPSQTPSGVKRLRNEELELLRGNGKGERKDSERIYDYDVYNDLGDPDNSANLKRPVLGGKERPYPRRIRTGRPKTKSDEKTESRTGGDFYVPRDETFSETKQLSFSAKTLHSLFNALIPSLEATITNSELGFSDFIDIDQLYRDGLNMHASDDDQQSMSALIDPGLVETIANTTEALVRFPQPEPYDRDKLFWLSDEEFARQTLAGVNPYSIQLVKEWPLMSQLDSKIYGTAESGITKELIETEFKGLLNVDEAMKQQKLFVLDYYDLFLPFVKKVRAIKGTTLYASRTLFFLKEDGTLKPLAIELCRPPIDDKPQWKRVYTQSTQSTSGWLWRLAKVHVLAHDSCHHEVVTHWLRTHCVVEPFIIAANRQLSAMHPIHKLLNPHFRYTMGINSIARQSLINANGTIESSFALRNYSIEFSSVAYDKQWKFDLQALPNDLISRGLAHEDPTAKHGLSLTIEDYPFANDGLLIWDALKEWITDYVNNFYPDSKSIESDEELQAFWTEIKTVGHGDKKDESLWPTLVTPEDLVGIITTIAWVASGHHAAVNFGQYAYGGYFPNRPSIARTKMPDEDSTEKEWKAFLNSPEDAFMKCLPSQIQAAKVMAVLNVLSTHSPDEEYVGQIIEPSWADDLVLKEAFERFSKKIKGIEQIINERNANMNLRNRVGAGIIPYELLKPSSVPGVTGKGVPPSISI